jgi:competence protein ComEA
MQKINTTHTARICGAFLTAVLAVAMLGPSSVSAAGERIDVNSASVGELTELPGIGASKAAAIIEERELAPFKSVDDLARVRGIGEATLGELRDHVRVGKPKSE